MTFGAGDETVERSGSLGGDILPRKQPVLPTDPDPPQGAGDRVVVDVTRVEYHEASILSAKRQWWNDGLGHLSHIYTNRGNISVSAGRESVGDYPNTVVMWGGGNIWGDITTNSGDITSIATPNSIHANLTASSGNIAPFSAGGDISGAITDHDGTIGRIVALSGSISGSIVSDGSIGSAGYGIAARNDITAAIVAGYSGTTYLLQAGRDIAGSFTGGNLEILKSGRDLSAIIDLTKGVPSLLTRHIGSTTVGRDLTGSLAATADIGTIAVGRAIKGNIESEFGSIASITAGESPWADVHTAAGSIGPGANNAPVTISAFVNIGDITVSAAAGEMGSITNATITAFLGTIGAISATSGIQAIVTAQLSIGDVTTPNGDIAGKLWSKAGNLGIVAADNGSITAKLLTGGSIGPILAGRNITGDIGAWDDIGTGAASYNGALLTGIMAFSGKISGNVLSEQGSIGSITAGADISGNVEAFGLIGNIWAGYLSHGIISGSITSHYNAIGWIRADELLGNIYAKLYIDTISILGNIEDPVTCQSRGTVTCQSGAIGGIFALGSIMKNLSAGTTMGTIHAFGDIYGNITAGKGDVFVCYARNVAGSVTAPGKKMYFAAGNVIETFADGTSNSPTQVAALSKPAGIEFRDLNGQTIGYKNMPTWITALNTRQTPQFANEWSTAQRYAILLGVAANVIKVDIYCLEQKRDKVLHVRNEIADFLGKSTWAIDESWTLFTQDDLNFAENDYVAAAQQVIAAKQQFKHIEDIYSKYYTNVPIPLIYGWNREAVSAGGSAGFEQARAFGYIWIDPQYDGNVASTGDELLIMSFLIGPGSVAFRAMTNGAAELGANMVARESIAITTAKMTESVTVNLGADIFPSVAGKTFVVGSNVVPSVLSMEIDVGTGLVRPLSSSSTVTLRAMTPGHIWDGIGVKGIPSSPLPLPSYATEYIELVELAEGKAAGVIREAGGRYSIGKILVNRETWEMATQAQKATIWYHEANHSARFLGANGEFWLWATNNSATGVGFDELIAMHAAQISWRQSFGYVLTTPQFNKGLFALELTIGTVDAGVVGYDMYETIYDGRRK
jgi:hypothetical protein